MLLSESTSQLEISAEAFNRRGNEIYAKMFALQVKRNRQIIGDVDFGSEDEANA
jgi:hypothetical protein